MGIKLNLLAEIKQLSEKTTSKGSLKLLIHVKQIEEYLLKLSLLCYIYDPVKPEQHWI